MLYYIFKLIV